ncbi:MAG: hypothetical protein RL385_5606, partial [Pseudomonadota bacterium]
EIGDLLALDRGKATEKDEKTEDGQEDSHRLLCALGGGRMTATLQSDTLRPSARRFSYTLLARTSAALSTGQTEGLTLLRHHPPLRPPMHRSRGL